MVRKNSKTQLISHENLIRKSNELSMAKLNQGLTLNQMQLLAFSIYCTQQNGVTEFHKADFEKKFGITQYKTEDARKDSDKVTSVKFSQWNAEKDYFDFWNIFRGMNYHKGIFNFTWAEEMIPHILELKEKYITTDLSIASKFKSGFSWTLYDYIKAHHGYWHKPISKSDLMKLFGVESKTAYQNNTSLFRQYVLDIAIEEINNHTELEVRYNVEKEGRAIVGFDLIWSNGERVTSATKKQVKEIQSIVEIVFEDMFQYVNINDENDRQRAINLMRGIEEMRGHTIEPISITKEKANDLIQKAVWNFRELNRLLEKNHKSVSPESIKKVEFYNWLEDRS